MTERAERAADELAERATVRVPEEDEELLGELAYPGQGNREADVILQQPVPEVPAALEVTRLNEERRQAERLRPAGWTRNEVDNDRPVVYAAGEGRCPMTVLTAPGLAILTPCEACERTGRQGKRACSTCRGSTYALWRVCPRCASQNWSYRNGRTEIDGMACGSCGASWTKDYPDWTIQRLPDNLEKQAG